MGRVDIHPLGGEMMVLDVVPLAVGYSTGQVTLSWSSNLGYALSRLVVLVLDGSGVECT